jgi:hypothetical protein
MNTDLNRLEAKVKAINLAGKEANRLLPQLREYFAQYVGTVVANGNATLRKRIKDKMPELPNDVLVRAFISVSTYNITLNISACANEHSCEYGKLDIAVVKLDCDGKLLELWQERTFREDWTVQEVLDKRRALQEAESVRDKVLSALGEFGRW